MDFNSMAFQNVFASEILPYLVSDRLWAISSIFSLLRVNKLINKLIHSQNEKIWKRIFEVVWKGRAWDSSLMPPQKFNYDHIWSAYYKDCEPPEDYLNLVSEDYFNTLKNEEIKDWKEIFAKYCKLHKPNDDPFYLTNRDMGKKLLLRKKSSCVRNFYYFLDLQIFIGSIKQLEEIIAKESIGIAFFTSKLKLVIIKPSPVFGLSFQFVVTCFVPSDFSISAILEKFYRSYDIILFTDQYATENTWTDGKSLYASTSNSYLFDTGAAYVMNESCFYRIIHSTTENRSDRFLPPSFPKCIVFETISEDTKTKPINRGSVLVNGKFYDRIFHTQQVLEFSGWKEASKGEKEKLCLAYLDQILFPQRVVKKFNSDLNLISFTSPSCKAKKERFESVLWITYVDVFYGFGITVKPSKRIPCYVKIKAVFSSEGELLSIKTLKKFGTHPKLTLFGVRGTPQSIVFNNRILDFPVHEVEKKKNN